MKNQKFTYIMLVFMGVVCFYSCQETQVSQEKTVPETPKVVRQKVAFAVQSQPGSLKKTTELTVNKSKKILPSKNITDIKKPELIEPQQLTPTHKPSKKDEPKAKPDYSSQSMPPDETDMELLLKKLAPKPFKYRPQGKVDPFLPLIVKKKKNVSQKSDRRQKAVRKKRRRILTLLEKFDLSQLKLTAVLRTSKNAVAIVEETSGRGFVVKTGTRIGLHSGRVVDILMDRIIIQETEEVIAGKKLFVTKEMKLNKPDSEF